MRLWARPRKISIQERVADYTNLCLNSRLILKRAYLFLQPLTDETRYLKKQPSKTSVNIVFTLSVIDEVSNEKEIKQNQRLIAFL
jgi:hypothetical protein